MEHMRVNNFGFREIDFDEKKSDNVFRVIAIGGSTTFGSGAIGSQTYPFILQEIFNKNPELNVEVINLGISGGWSYTEVKLINQKAINFEPDLIIVYDGWNDVISGRPEQQIEEKSDDLTLVFDGWKGVISGPLGDRQGDIFQYIDDPISSFLRNFKSLTSLKRIIIYGDDVYSYFNRTVTNYDLSHSNEKTNEWFSRWSKTCESLKQENIQVIIIIQPMAGTGEKKLTPHEQIWYTRYNNEAINKNLEEYADKLPLLDEYCLDTADFRTIFDDIETSLFIDNGHVTGLGNKILAERVYELILPHIQSIKNGQADL